MKSRLSCRRYHLPWCYHSNLRSSTISSHKWNTAACPGGTAISIAQRDCSATRRSWWGGRFPWAHNKYFQFYCWSDFQEPDIVIKPSNGNSFLVWFFFFLEHRIQDPYLPGRNQTDFQRIRITGEKRKAFNILCRRPIMVSALWAHWGVIHQSPDILCPCRHTVLIFKQLQEQNFFSHGSYFLLHS